MQEFIRQQDLKLLGGQDGTHTLDTGLRILLVNHFLWLGQLSRAPAGQRKLNEECGVEHHYLRSEGSLRASVSRPLRHCPRRT